MSLSIANSGPYFIKVYLCQIIHKLTIDLKLYLIKLKS